MSRRRSLGRIFLIPALLSVAALAGLIIGLLGHGWIDAIAVLGVALPVAAIAWALLLRRN